jgi:hypothetical protein
MHHFRIVWRTTTDVFPIINDRAMMDPSKWPRHRRLQLLYLRSFIYDGTEMERYITISGEVPVRSSFTGKRRD